MENFRYRGATGAALALQQDGGAHRGEFFDLLAEALVDRTLTHQTAIDIRSLDDGHRGGVGPLGMELLELESALQRGDEFIHAERFLHVIERAEL